MSEETEYSDTDLSTASADIIGMLLDDACESQVYRDILSANKDRPEILKLLVENPNISNEIREEAANLLHTPVKPAEKQRLSDDERKQCLAKKIQTFTVGEKIALAIRGGHDIRTLLAKDSNKGVVLTVLKNPKITVTEIELMAHSRNIPEDALRVISKNREWMKDYNIMLALINNPKTPAGIGMSMVANLKTKDLAILENNKNVSEAVRLVAKKLLQARQHD